MVWFALSIFEGKQRGLRPRVQFQRVFPVVMGGFVQHKILQRALPVLTMPPEERLCHRLIQQPLVLHLLPVDFVK